MQFVIDVRVMVVRNHLHRSGFSGMLKDNYSLHKRICEDEIGR